MQAEIESIEVDGYLGGVAGVARCGKCEAIFNFGGMTEARCGCGIEWECEVVLKPVLKEAESE